MIPPRLILASTSRYRRELLERLRLPFELRTPAVDESMLADESPVEMALRLAQSKARAVGSACPMSLIIGCDQVAALGNAALGKPGDH